MNINVTGEEGRGEKLKGFKVHTQEECLKRNVFF